MTMYNMIFGKNSNSDEILASIGLNQSDFYRFRDCYITNNIEIAVYTRGGGNNRCCWYDECDDKNHVDDCVVSIQENNRKHPLYLRDDDDVFDSTYATFYFRVPETLDIKEHGFGLPRKKNVLRNMFLDSLDELESEEN